MSEGGQDGIRAVGVDEVDQRLQVTSGRVVGGIVLQLARRWGTRYTTTGKIIWTEQVIADDTAA